MKKTAGQSRETIRPETGEQPPGLYIHIPFCVSKCAYCSFTSYPCRGEPPLEYLEAVLKQAEAMADHPWVRERRFASLFIGGGTPTIYGGKALAGLISRVLRLFSFCEQPEVSLEANPNTIDLGKLRCLKDAGVNRLSIGVQSFAGAVLAAIGRAHSREQACFAIEIAQKTGFDNLNLDLIFGLPRQNLAEWRQSLATAVEFGPRHLALYELMIEEGTPFARRLAKGDLDLPDEDEVAAMAETAREMLAEQGYRRYEISNYCLPGFACHHNINYWQNGSYLGLGAGAVSCLSGLRIANIADPRQYMRAVARGGEPYAEAEALSLGSRFRESVIMGLRLLEGVCLDDLDARFGLTPRGYYGTVLQELITRGLVETDKTHLRLTAAGLPVANQVLSELV